MKWGIGQYRREVQDVAWLTILQGFNYVLPLFVWPYLMMVLGAEKFGYIGFALAINQYLMIIVDFGFNFTASKQIALARNDKRACSRIFSAVLADKCYLLCVCALVLGVISCIPQYAVYRQTMWIMFGIVFANAFGLIWLFQGFGRIRKVSIINTICKFTLLPLTFVLVKNENDYLLAAGIQTTVYLLATIVTWLFVPQLGIGLVLTRWKEQWEQLKDSWMVCLSNAASGVYAMLLTVILAYFVSADEVGRYAAAEKIVRVIASMSVIPFTQAFYAEVSILGQESRVQGKRLINFLLIIMAVAMAIVAVAVGFGSDWICSILGNEYASAAPLLRGLACVPLLVAIGGICGQLGLLAMGGDKEKRGYRNTYLVAAIVALVIVACIAPHYGSIGAVASLLVAEGIVALGMSFYYAKMK